MDAAAFAITEAAPAKINLALHVTGRRADGYHLIESLAVFTRFGDLVRVGHGDADALSVSGPFARDVPLDGNNLVVRARDALRRIGSDGGPAIIELEKNLPVASGVGGGSSDAAATLRALTRLRTMAPDAPRLAEIALSLGADVPMCLEARPLIARGVGEDIALLPDFPVLALVLVNPGVAVSTAEVFARLPKQDNAPLPALPPKPDFGAVREWLAATRNDLEVPARTIATPIGAALAALEGAGAAFARMSGSGATCFGLFETGNKAKRAAAAIRKAHLGWFVAATRSVISKADEDGSTHDPD